MEHTGKKGSLPVVAVVCATGYQGRSVVNELHKTGKFHIRALTRNPESESAKKLLTAFPGIELVKSNNNDYASVEKAFTGADYAFLLTNFWESEEKLEPETDYRQGKILVDAAKAANVKFVVWSSLPDAEAVSKGEIDVPHFTQKARVDKHLKSVGLKHAIVYAGWYSNNWVRFGMGPIREKDGSLVLPMALRADVGFPVLDIEADFGKFVAPLFLDPEGFEGKTILAATEYSTTSQLAAAYTAVNGEYVKVLPIPMEAVPSKEIQEMFKFWNRHGCFLGQVLDHDSVYGKGKLNLNTMADWIKSSGFVVPK